MEAEKNMEHWLLVAKYIVVENETATKDLNGVRFRLILGAFG
jgi:hypothetical protein